MNAQFSGSSGLSHTFEFSIPSTGKKPERFVKTINEVTGDKINSTLFSWGDIKDSRRQGAQLYVFMNDSERKVRSDFTNALEVYGVHPVLWSSRDNYIEEIDFSNANLSNVTTTNSMFSNAINLKNVNFS